MLSLGSAFQCSLILVGVFHGYLSQICNVTVPTRFADGSIHERTQLGCCPGYVVAKIPRSTKTYCKAKCIKPCINGRCTAPNTCTCKPGYDYESEFTKTNCVPQCNSCTNGSCVAPNVCQCRLKFHKNEEGVCVPNCDPQCIHGTCTAPNVCQCQEGYQLKNSTKHLCQPVCEKECHNGNCSGVNECTCWDGFTREIKEDPQSKCMKHECINGEVDAEGMCQCPSEDHEIILRTTDQSIISECVLKKIPYCDQKCIDTSCGAEEKCQCMDGYERKEFGVDFQCLPTCNEECVNGNCTAPNVCECFEGFRVKEDNNKHCTPICDLINCTNGYCSSPNACSCNDGYEKWANDAQCHPICLTCSEKEECVAPGECQCKKGSRVSEKGVCEEITCNLGLITEEGICHCTDGWYLDKTGTCQMMVEEELKTSTIRYNQEIVMTTEDVTGDKFLEPITLGQNTEQEMNDDVFAYTEEDYRVTESDMEMIPTTEPPTCINGQVQNGKCICSDEDIQLMNNECVPRTTIEYRVPENMPKISCPEECASGLCHSNGTCKCPVHFKLAEDETGCVQSSLCEICFNDDSFPCPPYCFSTDYSPSIKSMLPQYLIILVACLITVVIVVILLILYKRMQKHEYYTGPVNNSVPIYAYELETLT